MLNSVEPYAKTNMFALFCKQPQFEYAGIQFAAPVGIN